MVREAVHVRRCGTLTLHGKVADVQLSRFSFSAIRIVRVRTAPSMLRWDLVDVCLSSWAACRPVDDH